MTRTEIEQQIVFDTPLSTIAVGVIAVALIALVGYSLVRQRHILGTPTTCLFGGLRLIALGTVIWMLLAPTRVRTETSSIRRSVVVMADTSGSMATVDPPGADGNEAWDRWSPVGNINDDAAAEAALVDIRFADTSLQNAIDALAGHGVRQRWVVQLQSVATAIARSEDHVRQFRRGQDAANVIAKTVGVLDRLQAPEIDAFEDLVLDLSKQQTPDSLDWRESLLDLQHHLRGIEGTIRELVREADDAPSNRNPAVAPEPRIERVARLMDRLKTRFADADDATFDLRWGRFAENATPIDAVQTTFTAALTDAAEGTDLTGAIQHVGQHRGGDSVAAAILMTDAAHNPAATPASDDPVSPESAAAETSNVPFYVVPIGNTQRLRDVQLLSVDSPPIAMRNDNIVIEASIQAHRCAGQTCTVELLQNGTVIDFRELRLDADFISRTVQFDHRVSEVGDQIFQVAARPIDGETTTENNFLDVGVQVTRSQLRVLLADEMPRWEYRYLSQLFRRDGKIDCDELLFRPRSIATGLRQATASLPETVDDWDQYDIVILGDLDRERFNESAQSSLVEYLRSRGGTAILIAGAQSMPASYSDSPLGKIVPVRHADDSAGNLAGAAFRITDAGRRHAALMIGSTRAETDNAWSFINQFSPLDEVSPWRIPLASATNLIAVDRRIADVAGPTAESETLGTFLCWQPIARGRVIYLSGPETYRLRFLRGDPLHHRFWGQLLRWAIAADLAGGSRQVRIRTENSRLKTGQTARVVIELSDEQNQRVGDVGDASLRVTGGGQTRVASWSPLADDPGTFVADVTGLPPGTYRAQAVGQRIDSLWPADYGPPPSTSFTIASDLPPEMIDTRSDLAMAHKIAAAGGGQVLSPAAVDELFELMDLSPIVSQIKTRQPIWPRWSFLLLVFGCLQTEWVIRKGKGWS